MLTRLDRAGRPSRARTLAPAAGLLALGLAVALGLSGCSGGAGQETTESADTAARTFDGSQSRGSDAAGSAAAPADQAAQAGQAEQAAQVAPQQAQVISTGEVSLTARDVAASLGTVRQVVSQAGGSVQKESTDTDEDGRPSSAYLTVRVPSSEFATSMTALGKAGTLDSTSSHSKDVTTVVLDNNVRVQVAQRSIDRISTLLDQATSIRDVISIESELAQRQADLASLESQQKYLADQTSLATITVSIDRRSDVAPTPDDDTGFAAGLGAGWHALAGTASGVATGAGAALPWLVVVVVVAIPVRLVLRRRRGRSAQAA